MIRTLKAQALNGEKIRGTMLRVERNPAVAYLAKDAGLDFIMFDCEHSNYNLETLHDFFVTANALGLAGLVRVPNLSKDYISRYLDAGASGVMVPMIETAEQAETLVKYSKYAPLGLRGYTTTGAHTDYTLVPNHVEIMKTANESTIAIAQIETAKGVENAFEIASVEGIDMLLIGPNDLSVSLGIPGELSNPIQIEAMEKVAEACKKAGKLFAIHGGKPMLQKFADKLDVVMTGTDIDMLYKSFKGVCELAEELYGK